MSEHALISGPEASRFVYLGISMFLKMKSSETSILKEKKAGSQGTSYLLFCYIAGV